MKQIDTHDIKTTFESDGWVAVWQGLIEKKFASTDVALFAESKSRMLVDRPPVDPFWIAGGEAAKKIDISPEIRCEVVLAWLYASKNGGWDGERLKLEMKFLIDTGFIEWSMSLPKGQTLAEAVIDRFAGSTGVVTWALDWNAVSVRQMTEWLGASPKEFLQTMKKDSIITRKSRTVEAVVFGLDLCREKWSTHQLNLVEKIMADEAAWGFRDGQREEWDKVVLMRKAKPELLESHPHRQRFL
jgi:hypothetical protein